MRTMRATLRVVLTLLASCPGLVAERASAGTIVRFSVVDTFFDVELFDEQVPTTVQNFLSYVNQGSYTSTFIHRSTTQTPSAGINVIQGGGFTYAGGTFGAVVTSAPIPLEAGISNTRGTIAMARGEDPNTATSQWFFNVTDNLSLDPNPFDPNPNGYAVFGTVLDQQGLNVLDAIAGLGTYNLNNFILGQPTGPFGTVPLIVSGPDASLVMINGIAPVPEPSTLVLAGVGLAAAAFTAARRARRVAG